MNKYAFWYQDKNNVMHFEFIKAYDRAGAYDIVRKLNLPLEDGKFAMSEPITEESFIVGVVEYGKIMV